MSTKIEKLEKNIVKLEIEIDVKILSKEYDRACKRIAQRVNIAGFRKGKAPKNIIEKHVGIEDIKKESLEALLPKEFSDVIRENKFDVVSDPYVESYDYEIGKNATVIAKIELRPEVQLGNYKGLKVDVEEFLGEENALNKELEQIVTRYTTLETSSKQQTDATDIVMFDFEGFVDGNPIKSGAAKNHMLDLSNSNFIPGFAEQLIGKNVNEDYTIDVTFPEAYHDETLKGKAAKFNVKINEIKEKIKPELNDEFAQKISAFKTLDELKADIKKYIEIAKKTENEKRSSSKIFEHIMNEATVEIQETMINREAQALANELQQRINAQGGNFEKMVETEGKDKILNELKSEAHNRIKNSLVISQIAKNENIQVSAEDFDSKIAELAKMYNTDRNGILTELRKNTQLIHSLTQQALSQKVTAFLIKNNEINFIKDVNAQSTPKKNTKTKTKI